MEYLTGVLPLFCCDGFWSIVCSECVGDAFRYDVLAFRPSGTKNLMRIWEQESHGYWWGAKILLDWNTFNLIGISISVICCMQSNKELCRSLFLARHFIDAKDTQMEMDR